MRELSCVARHNTIRLERSRLASSRTVLRPPESDVWPARRHPAEWDPPCRIPTPRGGPSHVRGEMKLTRKRDAIIMRTDGGAIVDDRGVHHFSRNVAEAR